MSDRRRCGLRLFRSRILLGTCAVAAVFAACVGIRARADMEPWLQTTVSGSALESALYRLMDLPGLRTLYLRPPAEARRELDKLVDADPAQAQLYALRAHVEEQALDFASAERD